MHTRIPGLLVLLCLLPAWAPAPALADEAPPIVRSVAERPTPPAVPSALCDTMRRAESERGLRPSDGTWLEGCCLQRDECGWLLDECGRRQRRFTANFQIGVSTLDGPDGSLALPGLTPPIDWGAESYGAGLGSRWTVGYQISPRSLVELRGTVYGTWEAEGSQTQLVGSQGTDGPTSTTLSLDSDACLYGGEANFWRELRCRGNVRFRSGAGFRYLELWERARAEGSSLAGGTGKVESEVSNTFLGGQFMLGALWDPTPRFQLLVNAKGLLGSLDRDVEVTDSLTGAGQVRSTADDEDFGWGVEAEVEARYRINRWLSITAAYVFLYVPDVTRAHDDFASSGVGAVGARRVDSDLLHHTFFAGFEIRL